MTQPTATDPITDRLQILERLAAQIGATIGTLQSECGQLRRAHAEAARQAAAASVDEEAGDRALVGRMRTIERKLDELTSMLAPLTA